MNCRKYHWLYVHSFDTHLADFIATPIPADLVASKAPEGDAFECSDCPVIQKSICLGSNFPECSCFTCCHATFDHKRLMCERCNQVPPIETQKEGCPGHIFLPDLIPWPAIDGDPEYILYELPDGRKVCNVTDVGFPPIDSDSAPTCYSSQELATLYSVNLLTDKLDSVKQVFSGKVVSEKS